MGMDCHALVGLFSALVGESFLLFSGGPSLRSTEFSFVSGSLEVLNLSSGHVEILWPSVAEKV